MFKDKRNRLPYRIVDIESLLLPIEQMPYLLTKTKDSQEYTDVYFSAYKVFANKGTVLRDCLYGFISEKYTVTRVTIIYVIHILPLLEYKVSI